MRLTPSISIVSGLLLAATTVLANQPSSSASLSHTVPMQRHAAGTFYVDARLQGLGDLNLLVDTGSSYLVIGQDMLEQLEEGGNAKFLREIGGRMADNSVRQVPIYRVARLRLGDSCWISDVEAAVFPAGIRPILGMRTLERLSPFTFSAAPAQLGLSHCELPAITQAQSADESSLARAEALAD